MSACTDQVRVAAIQMVSGPELSLNLKSATGLLNAASAQGARVAVLPENFGYFGSSELQEIGRAEQSRDGPLRSFLAEAALRLGLWIVGGTIPIADSGSKRVRSACLVVNPNGVELARYDKMHLFDVEVGDAQGRYRESDDFIAGRGPCAVDMPLGTTGLAVCYDLRFPELFRQLALGGCSAFVVPAAFTAATGAAHWELLLRARAVENLSWVIGAGQGGVHPGGRETWGHSMIVNPWGEVLAQAERGEDVVIADLDLTRPDKLRVQMPVLAHTRFRIEQC